MVGCPHFTIKPIGRFLVYDTEFFWRTEECHIRIGVVHESTSTSRAEKLSDAAPGWVYRRTLSPRRQHRTIGSILRNGLRRSHSEQRRQQRRASLTAKR